MHRASPREVSSVCCSWPMAGMVRDNATPENPRAPEPGVDLQRLSKPPCVSPGHPSEPSRQVPSLLTCSSDGRWQTFRPPPHGISVTVTKAPERTGLHNESSSDTGEALGPIGAANRFQLDCGRDDFMHHRSNEAIIDRRRATRRLGQPV